MIINQQQFRRVAIIHYWLVGMRGGERVVESLCRMFPQADIYTHVANRTKLSTVLTRHRIIETRIGRMPFARTMYQKYLPFMPRALEDLDLSGYDLVISSEAGPAKGVIAPPDAPHLCYCHSPMRYLWDQYHIYRNGAGAVTQALMPHAAHKLRQWDVNSAQRVDGFVANSNFVAQRIGKYWRRNADVVPPPVNVGAFRPVPKSELGNFYLWAGELAPYKRPDIAVEAFRQLDKPLIVIGGPNREMRALKARAGRQTTFLGKVPFAVLKDHMARCKALVLPGEEDFGIVPVEVMASGRPVIAYGRGGILDTVVDGATGLLFKDQSVDGLTQAIREFEASGLGDADPATCIKQAQRFSEAAFVTGIEASLAKIGLVAA